VAKDIKGNYWDTSAQDIEDMVEEITKGDLQGKTRNEIINAFREDETWDNPSDETIQAALDKAGIAESFKQKLDSIFG
jgi:hypothetical protein